MEMNKHGLNSNNIFITQNKILGNLKIYHKIKLKNLIKNFSQPGKPLEKDIVKN